MIGPAAIPMIADFLADTHIAPRDRISAPTCLGNIAAAHGDRRDECVGLLVRQLENFRINGSDLNAWIIYALIDLGAVETIDPIRRAFRADCVDISLSGDLEEVEISLGLRQKRDTPRPRFVQLPDLFSPHELASDDEFPPQLPYRREEKVGRNDPCPCGSGKKFKKCCGMH
ncbi:MAG: SEC-C domain-containing protein [Alphaproteobacteria bacterium]|nr:SEC-C domain-containing protein [Alphaproteobacteria bacterium]